MTALGQTPAKQPASPLVVVVVVAIVAVVVIVVVKKSHSVE